MNLYMNENRWESHGQSSASTSLAIRRAWLRRLLSVLLALALGVLSLSSRVSAYPSPVQFPDRSGNLPGVISGKAAAAAILGGAAVVGLATFIILKKKRGDTRLNLYAPCAKFKNIVSGQATNEIVSVTNHMHVAVTIKNVMVDDRSQELSINPGHLPRILPPGDTLDLPVTLSANKGGGKIRLRVIATTEKLERQKKEGVKFVHVSYSTRR
jgi:hypothetical protein